MKNSFPTVLVILDGFGYSPRQAHNAIAQADMPCFEFLLNNYPATLLAASGPAVGLPEGYIGNSEVGHLTIGSGTAVPQPFTIIENAIASGELLHNPILLKNLAHLKKTGGTLHLIGLLSDAAVHSHIHHLFYYLKAAKQADLTDVVVHPILDGRDVAPESAEMYLSSLEATLKTVGCGRIGTIVGRFYAMDRNRNWNLTKQAYNALTKKQKPTVKNWQELLSEEYAKGIFDEFIPPTQLDSSAIIKDGDGVIFFNFRPDRARQLTACFVQKIPSIISKKVNLLFFITPVSYGPEYSTTVLYQKLGAEHYLTDVLYDHGYSIFSIAETEKYAHVTYFFNGGREKKRERETRVLIPSLPSREYREHPCMSAKTITEAVVDSLQHAPHDFYVINYANADMVGHTGDFKATVKALECLDKQLKILYDLVTVKMNGTLFITGDHGKAEDMFDEERNQPRTAHTANPVYFVMARKDLKNATEKLPLAELADIAPFVLHTMMPEEG